MGTCTLLLTHRCSHGSTDRQTAVSSAAGLVGSFGGANELLYLTSYIKGNDLKINKQQTALRHKPEACSVLVFPGLGLVTRAHKTAQCKTPYKQKQLKASWPSSQNGVSNLPVARGLKGVPVLAGSVPPAASLAPEAAAAAALASQGLRGQCGRLLSGRNRGATALLLPQPLQELCPPLALAQLDISIYFHH